MFPYERSRGKLAEFVRTRAQRHGWPFRWQIAQNGQQRWQLALFCTPSQGNGLICCPFWPWPSGFQCRNAPHKVVARALLVMHCLWACNLAKKDKIPCHCPCSLLRVIKSETKYVSWHKMIDRRLWGDFHIFLHFLLFKILSGIFSAFRS